MYTVKDITRWEFWKQDYRMSSLNLFWGPKGKHLDMWIKTCLMIPYIHEAIKCMLADHQTCGDEELLRFLVTSMDPVLALVVLQRL